MHKKTVKGKTYYYTSVRINGKIKTFYLGKTHEEAMKKEKRIKQAFIRSRDNPRSVNKKKHAISNINRRILRLTKTTALVALIITVSAIILILSAFTGNLVLHNSYSGLERNGADALRFQSIQTSYGSESIELEMISSEYAEFSIKIENTLSKNATFRINATGDTARFITISQRSAILASGESADINARVFIPPETIPGLYKGRIEVSADQYSDYVPVQIRVLQYRHKFLHIEITPLVNEIIPGEPIPVETRIYNLGTTTDMKVLLKMQLIDPMTETTVKEIKESILVETNFVAVKKISTDEDMPEGKYMIRAVADYVSEENRKMSASSISYVTVRMPWYLTKLFNVIPVWLLLAFFAVVALITVTLRYHHISIMKRRRYQEKIDFSSLPQAGKRSAFIGKIAETAIRTFLPIDRLQTHTIVAGATGSGKTIASQVIAEEVLLKGGSVIVFDPTAQWTGFFRKCTDKRMLSRYEQFEMKTKNARSFKGSLYVIDDPHELIDLKKFMNPGEITVFCINNLSTTEMDVFVVNTIQQVFRLNPEESPILKTLLVYDEVHRLLPKFGGSGRGFIQIERGCREFRKWGIGLLLVSQVLSDFVGEIKANIGTEIQMRTWYEGDLDRIRMKYGEDISKSVVKEGIGTGMIVNSEYNKGRPYFVSFRPILHSTSRLSDDELAQYDKYNKIIDDILFQTSELKKLGVDVFDIEIELKLAKDKVREGAFNMVDIYLESIKPRIESEWKKLGKTPPEKEQKYISSDELEKGLQEARKSREEYLKEHEGAKEEKHEAPIEKLKKRMNELESKLNAAKSSGKNVLDIENEAAVLKPNIELLSITKDAVEIEETLNKVESLIKKLNNINK